MNLSALGMNIRVKSNRVAWNNGGDDEVTLQIMSSDVSMAPREGGIFHEDWITITLGYEQVVGLFLGIFGDNPPNGLEKALGKRLRDFDIP